MPDESPAPHPHGAPEPTCARRAGGALRAGEEHFRQVVAAVRDYAVFLLDPQGRVASWNAGAERIKGYAAEEILGQHFSTFYPAEDLQRGKPEEELRVAAAEGRYEDEGWRVRKGGSRFWAGVVITAWRDEAGTVRGYLKITQDLTGKKQAEEAARRLLREEAARRAAEQYAELLRGEREQLRESEARKAAILETAPDCVITIDHEGRLIEFNPAAERTFGYRRADVLGREMAGLIVPPSLRDSHHRGLARYLATGEGPVLNRRVEMPALRADGTEFPVELAITRMPTRGPPVFTAYVRDITERREAERRRNARLAVTQTLAQSLTLWDAAPDVLRAVCEGLGWDVGLLWVVDPQARVLRCEATWHRPSAQVGEFEAVSRESRFGEGVGLPGRVWSSRQPAWVPDVVQDQNFPRTAVAAREGLHGAFASPVMAGPEVLGVLEFFSGEVREPDPDLLEMVATLGGQVGQFTERRGAERELHRQEEERRIARHIQRGLLPKAVPTLPGFEFSGRSVAAADVGGDCFDFLPLAVGDQESLGVLVADASGHGVGAALLVAETRAYLRALALTGAGVGTLLSLANRRLTSDLVTDHFVTVFLLRLDLHNRYLVYSSAGHWPGYVLDPRGRTKAVLASTGVPLGTDPAGEFPESPAVPLERGALVFLFTDGITEASSPEGKLFGLDRTLEVVRAHREQTPEGILDALFGAVGDFSGHHFHDDLTAVVLKADGGA